ncbi:MAG: hypothetical protein Q4F84_08275, partial [Fibrobacter sp.]|nr:hypothetical protein [Fibrobacter sp.]
MGVFSGNPKDEKISGLENEAQERLRRIGTLRAQISTLAAEENKFLQEYDLIKKRLEGLNHRKDELASLKKEEISLTQEIKRRESILSGLQEQILQLQSNRGDLIQRTAKLRSQVSNEENEIKRTSEELLRLDTALSEHEARKLKITEETKLLKKTQEELEILERDYAQIQERIPLCRKKYEQTKLLIDEIKNNTDPVFQIILEIWKKLPDDV